MGLEHAQSSNFSGSSVWIVRPYLHEKVILRTHSDKNEYMSISNGLIDSNCFQIYSHSSQLIYQALLSFIRFLGTFGRFS